MFLKRQLRIQFPWQFFYPVRAIKKLKFPIKNSLVNFSVSYTNKSLFLSLSHMFNEKKRIKFHTYLEFHLRRAKNNLCYFFVGRWFIQIRASEWVRWTHAKIIWESNLNHKTANIAERWRKSFKFLPLLSFCSLHFKTHSYSAAAAVRIIFNFKKLSRFNRYIYIYIFVACLLVV